MNEKPGVSIDQSLILIVMREHVFELILRLCQSPLLIEKRPSFMGDPPSPSNNKIMITLIKKISTGN
jgi:hypothetical protein